MTSVEFALLLTLMNTVDPSRPDRHWHRDLQQQFNKVECRKQELGEKGRVRELILI
jgi:hypothetical protein